MAWRVGVELPDPSEETFALISLLGRSMDFESFPLPDDAEGLPLMTVSQAANVLGSADYIRAPTRLNLLSHLPRDESLRTAVYPIAESLVRQEQTESEIGSAVERLWERIEDTERGGDPLFGDFTDFHRFDNILGVLTGELREASVIVSPTCEATTKVIAGSPALSLKTTIRTVDPLAAVKLMADPRNWPLCSPQSTFFKSMKMVAPTAPPLPALKGPDVGWSATLREVVDFGFGIIPSLKTTDLDVVFFEEEHATGCTYDLNRSFGDEILVDQGYVLMEDLRSLDLRRTTTLKQVYLRSRPPPGNVCRLWSMAHGMISSSCMLKQRPVSGSAP